MSLLQNDENCHSMALFGKILYPKKAQANTMKLAEKVSWLMGRVQKSLLGTSI
jgi:hypothetical protein